MDKTTFFTSAAPASPFKKLAAYFLDFFVAAVLLLGIFAIEEAIINNTPMIKDNQTKIAQVLTDMKNLTLESKLSQMDANGSLIGQSEIVTNYIHGAARESLVRNGDESFSESLYTDYPAVDETNDNCYFYYTQFKVSKLADYSSTSQQECGVSYYRKALLDGCEESYFETSSDYPYLTLTTAKSLDEYFRNSGYSIGGKIYDNLSSSYLNLLKVGITDIQKNYQPFLDLQKQYEQTSSFTYDVKTWELIVGYVLAMTLYFYVLPLILKDGRTLSFKIMGLGVTNQNHERLAWYNYLVKLTLNLLEYLPMMAVTAIIFFGSSGVELISHSLGVLPSLLLISFYALVAMLLDFVVSFFFREKRQTFTEFAAGEIVKDANLFKAAKERKLNE